MIFYIILFLIFLATVIVIWGEVSIFKRRNKEEYNKKDIINIFLCTDKNQEEGLYAVINSILTNLNPVRKIKFYILVDSNREYFENKLLSQKLVTKDHLEIQEIPPGEYSDKCQKINQNMQSDSNKQFTEQKKSGTLSIMNLARFLSPEIFKNVRKAIYMDVDMINELDISELFDIDLNGKGIASPLIMTSGQMKYDKSLNVPNTKMFNAGIYLFDVEAWRKNDLTNKSLELMEKNSQKKLYNFNTQPAINYFFINEVKDIDKRWNTPIRTSSITNIKEAYVLHWPGKTKPWHDNGQYKEGWDKYSYKEQYSKECGRSREYQGDYSEEIEPFSSYPSYQEGFLGKNLENFLIQKEEHYGGLVQNIKINNTSPLDPRTIKRIANVRMQGGDRMSSSYHNYAPIYAKYLQPYLNNDNIVLVEVGILKGSGCAIWSDLFKNGRIIGLDHDLSYIKNNMKFLKSKGAFSNNNLELHNFDSYKPKINKILNGDTIDIFIDDGPHDDKAILTNLKEIVPHLSKKFVYFIEDNTNVHNKIRKNYSKFKVINGGEMTIIIPRE